MKPEDLSAAIKATQTIVSKLTLVNQKKCAAEILLLKKLLKDDKNVIGEAKVDQRGKHWAELRSLQKYLLVDEYGHEKELSHDELLALSNRSEHKLKLDFYRGQGSLNLQVVDKKTYKRTDVTITKL